MGPTPFALFLAATKTSGAKIDWSSVGPAAIAVITALVALMTAVIQLRQSRVRAPDTRDAANDGDVISLETEPDKPWTNSEKRNFAAAPRGMALFGGAFLLGGLFGAFRVTTLPSAVLALSYVLEGLIGLIFGISKWSQIKGKSPGDALGQCEATLVMSGTHSSVLARVRRAMNSLGAVRSAGTRIADLGSGASLIVGGTGDWPNYHKGQRLTVTITREENVAWTVRVESCSFVPQRQLKERNARNVRRVLEQLVA